MKAKRVLIFNAESRRLLTISSSCQTAAYQLRVMPKEIRKVCEGKAVSAYYRYFRYLDESVNITWDDFGKLKVEEYDRRCGIERQIKRCCKNFVKSLEEDKK